MEHLRDMELIELSAGRLDTVSADRATLHLQTCPSCLDRFTALSAVDRAMEGWRDTPSVDLAERVLGSVGKMPTVPVSSWQAPLRIAAAVAISIAAGHVAARVWEKPMVETQRIEEHLQLAALSEGSGLSDWMLDEVLSEEVIP